MACSGADELLRDSFALDLQIIESGFRPSFLVGVRTSSDLPGIDRPGQAVRVHAIDELVSRLDADDRQLLIDDVLDSGRSLEAVMGELARRYRRVFAVELSVRSIAQRTRTRPR